MKQTHNPASIHSPVGMNQTGNIPEEISEQFQLAYENIQKNLAEADMTTKDLVKLTIYLVETIDTLERTRFINEFLKREEVAMTLLYVNGLANPKLRVEFDAMACQ